MTGVIYALSCACDSDVVRYVGQSRYTALERLDGHRKDARRGSQLPVHKWIRKHTHSEGCSVTTTPLEHCTLDALNERERYWRVRMVDLGHDLLNCSADDYTPMGDETRAKISASAVLRYSDPEERLRERERQIAAWQDEQLRARASADARQRYESRPEIREKLSASARRVHAENPTRGAQSSSKLTEMWRDPATRVRLAKSTHTRWHTNRGITKEGCVYCFA